MTEPPDPDRLVRRHLRFGWWSLLVFVVLGAVLESLHGFKVDWYLAVGAETRRLTWRLAHAHGTFLALVHLGFAFTVKVRADRRGAETVLPRLASPCLLGASVALPGGFLLGGVAAQGGDPGAAIALVPLGAALLVVAIANVAWICTRRG